MPIIQVEELVKQYAKARTPAVKGVSFSVNEGNSSPSSAPMVRVKPPPSLF